MRGRTYKAQGTAIACLRPLSDLASSCESSTKRRLDRDDVVLLTVMYKLHPRGAASWTHRFSGICLFDFWRYGFVCCWCLYLSSSVGLVVLFFGECTGHGRYALVLSAEFQVECVTNHVWGPLGAEL